MSSAHRWWRPGLEVVHLGGPYDSAAYCGRVLADMTDVASNRRVCGHCLRSRKVVKP